MINNAKCPGCNAGITNVQVEDVTVSIGLEQRWKGVSYSCPACHRTLSVQINPLTIKQDINSHVERVAAKLATTMERDISRKVVREIKKLLGK